MRQLNKHYFKRCRIWAQLCDACTCRYVYMYVRIATYVCMYIYVCMYLCMYVFINLLPFIDQIPTLCCHTIMWIRPGSSSCKWTGTGTGTDRCRYMYRYKYRNRYRYRYMYRFRYRWEGSETSATQARPGSRQRWKLTMLESKRLDILKGSIFVGMRVGMYVRVQVCTCLWIAICFIM